MIDGYILRVIDTGTNKQALHIYKKFKNTHKKFLNVEKCIFIFEKNIETLKNTKYI